VDDALRAAVFAVVVTDPIGAVLAAHVAGPGWDAGARRRAGAAAAVAAAAVLAGAALLATPVLDAMRISAPAAQLAAGCVLVVPLVLQLGGGRPVLGATAGGAAVRVGAVPLGVPVVAGPAAVATVLALAPSTGTAAAIAGTAIAWVPATTSPGERRGPRARAVALTRAAATALVAFDLVRDGVFGA
jgi:multiple antibiotic resistance protein